jgi:hypothetical protein
MKKRELGRDVMHAVTRSYSGKGAKELIDVLEKNKADIEKLIKSITGFVSYSLVRTPEGGFSVSVFQDKAGVEESVRVARDWIGKNASNRCRCANGFGRHCHSTRKMSYGLPYFQDDA